MSVTLLLPTVLRGYAGGQSRLSLPAPDPETLGELLDQIARTLPAVERRVRDETGTLRRHVNVFIDGENARYCGGVHAPVPEGAEVQVLAAVSGGLDPF